MDFLSRLSRTEPGEVPTDLSQVHADDALIESLRSVPLFDEGPAETPVDDALTYGAHARPVPAAKPTADIQVASMLRSWRREIDSTPLPPQLDIEIATSIVRSAPQRRRAVRPMMAVTAAIAALLIGSAAIGARSATPESPLWAVTQVLWADRADSVLAGISAREGIASASQALDAGHPEEAQSALVTVTSVITQVQPGNDLTTLQSDYNKVKTAVEQALTTSATSSSQSSTSTAPTLPSATSTTSTEQPIESSPVDNGSDTSPLDSTTSPDGGTSQPEQPTDSVDTTTTETTPTTSDSTTETTTTTDTPTTETTPPDNTDQAVTDPTTSLPDQGGNEQIDQLTTTTTALEP